MRDVGRAETLCSMPGLSAVRGASEPSSLVTPGLGALIYAMRPSPCRSSRNVATRAVHERPRDAPQQRPKKAQWSCVENKLSIKCQVEGQWSPGFVRDPHFRLWRPSGVDALGISHPDTVCLRNPFARSILGCTYPASVDRQIRKVANMERFEEFRASFRASGRPTTTCSEPHHHKVLGRGRGHASRGQVGCARVLNAQRAVADERR
jgi:hypothetical protein